MVEGPRPGELDALRWDRIRWEAGEVEIVEQWNAKTRTFTEPKYGPYTIALVARGRDVLRRMKRDSAESPFVFTTLRGNHYRPTSRVHHWNRVRAAAGLGNMSLYLATRALLGLVRPQRPGAGAARDRRAARPPGRRQARGPALRAPGRGARPAEDPRGA
jgi:hypothetical protein